MSRMTSLTPTDLSTRTAAATVAEGVGRLETVEGALDDRLYPNRPAAQADGGTFPPDHPLRAGLAAPVRAG